ncbi:MAG: ATP-binding protein, partial [Victivallaceae bacterium]|nr:ATP-binding protein [Victivallaceae bacterium]
MNSLLDIDFAELINRGVESDVLDYKAPMNWGEMSRAAKAKIVRHCVAMANTRGGCVVIGVAEDAAGRPVLRKGLSEVECRSFDPSAIITFINRCVDPPIDIGVERPVVDGKRYAVLVVNPFKLLPHVATTSIDDELRTGVLYLRTVEASSRPAYRAAEMQTILQRALRNQREELARMLRGILYECGSANGAVSAGADADFKVVADGARNFFLRRKAPPDGVPALLVEFAVRPCGFREGRFPLNRLKEAVSEASPAGVPVASAYLTNVSLRSLPPDDLCMWQIFDSGLFHYIRFVPDSGKRLEFGSLRQMMLGAVEFFPVEQRQEFFRPVAAARTPDEIDFRVEPRLFQIGGAFRGR